jgi:hypothetical protein
MKVAEAIKELSQKCTLMNARIAVLEQRTALLEINRDQYKELSEKLIKQINFLTSKSEAADVVEGLMRNEKK